MPGWIGGPWIGVIPDPRYSNVSSFDFGQGEAVPRPRSGYDIGPTPPMIGAVQGVLRTFDKFTLAIAIGKNGYGTTNGGMVPATPITTFPQSLSKREG